MYLQPDTHQPVIQWRLLLNICYSLIHSRVLRYTPDRTFHRDGTIILHRLILPDRCISQLIQCHNPIIYKCVVSFIDRYEKTKRNFPQARSVTAAQQEQLIETFSKIAAAKGIQIHLCCEDRALTGANVDADGCLSQTVLERAIGSALHVPKKKMARDACSCLLGADIGMYNTCWHGCLYCYANYDNESVRANRKLHDPASPLLIGHLHETDIVKEAEQKLWQDGQLSLFQMGF